MYQLELIKYKDLLLNVKRKFKDSELKSNFDTNIMKEWTKTDLLLRKDGILYCCEIIPNAQIIEQ